MPNYMNNAGHKDYEGATPEQFYVVALWFANPIGIEEKEAHIIWGRYGTHDTE